MSYWTIAFYASCFVTVIFAPLGIGLMIATSVMVDREAKQ